MNREMKKRLNFCINYNNPRFDKIIEINKEKAVKLTETFQKIYRPFFGNKDGKNE